MVINRDRKSFGSSRKSSVSYSDDWHRWRFFSAFGLLRNPFAECFRMSKSSWIMDPTCSREIPSCSTTDLAEFRWSSKVRLWFWSINSGMITVLCRPVQSGTQVEKSPRLTWATQFLTVAYDGACSRNVCIRMAWISFVAMPYRKNNSWQLASLLCWNRARRLTCFFSASITRKDLQFSTWTDPYFRQYGFRPKISGKSSVWGLISTPS